jgi:hypothetical protein
VNVVGKLACNSSITIQGNSTTFQYNHPPTATAQTATLNVMASHTATVAIDLKATARLKKKINKATKLILNYNNSDPDTKDSIVVLTPRPAYTTKGGKITATDTAYKPPPNFTGSDKWTYTLADTRGGTVSTSITITVTNPTVKYSFSSLPNAAGYYQASQTITSTHPHHSFLPPTF